MRHVATLLVLSLVLSITGCAELRPLLGTSTHAAPRTGSVETLRRTINHHAARRTVRVLLLDGQTFSADRIEIERDTTRWLDSETGTPTAVPSRDVRQVVVPRRSVRANEGAFLGLLAGLAVSIALPWVVDGTSGAGPVLVPLGIAFGLVTSASSGGEATYVFRPPAD